MITLYTDGSSRGNPGRGGYGVILIGNKKVVELGGREDMTTNNRMELRATIEGLRYLDNKKITGDILIKTDSQYVLKGATEWIEGWIKKGWIGSNKKAVLNQDLWQELHSLLQKYKPRFLYVRGHAGIAGNERADEIATTFADNEPTPLYSGDKAGYPIQE